MKPLVVNWLVVLVLFVLSPAAARAGFTFFLTGDTHYGLDLFYDNEPHNKATIDAMNALPGTPFPAALGGVVDVPRGVLVAGDVTDTADTPFNFYGIHVSPALERDGFNDDYAVDGSGRLQYPVYEGYGNHDVDNASYSYTLQGIRERNLVRPGLTHLSDNGLHYSWDWEGVHFVNLNIYPGETERAGDSLSFLVDDLQTYVGDSGRPVVLMHHFGFDSFSLGWWSDAERQAYADAIAPYNVLGIFHGHLHTELQYQWNGYDVFDGSAAKDGNFLVVRIDEGRMDVAARSGDQWGFTFSKTFVVPEPSGAMLAVVAAAAIAVFLRASRPASTSLGRHA